MTEPTWTPLEDIVKGGEHAARSVSLLADSARSDPEGRLMVPLSLVEGRLLLSWLDDFWDASPQPDIKAEPPGLAANRGKEQQPA